MKLKNLYLTLISLLVFCGLAYSQNSHFTYTATATGPSTGLNLTFGGINYNQITWTVSGTVSSCTVALDSSVDGVTWTSGGAITGQTCTSNGNSTVVSGTFNYVRINVTALGGTGATVNVVYDGWIVNPSGGGSSNMPIYAQTTVAAGDTTTVDGTVFTSGTYTWSANQFCSGGAGQVYHLHATALLSTSAADNFGLTVWLGGTEIAGGNGMFTPTGLSNNPIMMDVNITCISTGATGSIEVSWQQAMPQGTSANSGSAVQVNPPNTATITVNTTSSVALQIKSRINNTGSETLRQTIITY